MTLEEHIESGIKKNIAFFIKQYGEKNFVKLKEEVLSDLSVIKLYENTSVYNPPTADVVINTCTLIDFISNETYLINYTSEEFEKRLDYLYYSSIIILQNWRIEVVPYKIGVLNLDQLTESSTLMNILFKTGEFLDRIKEIYLELEKNYK